MTRAAHTPGEHSIGRVKACAVDRPRVSALYTGPMATLRWQSLVDFVVLAVAIAWLLRWSLETRALRLEVKLQPDVSGGILEWKLK